MNVRDYGFIQFFQLSTHMLIYIIKYLIESVVNVIPFLFDNHNKIIFFGN